MEPDNTVEIAKWLQAQYDGGRTTAISPQEMEEQIIEHLTKHYPQLERIAQQQR